MGECLAENTAQICSENFPASASQVLALVSSVQSWTAVRLSGVQGFPCSPNEKFSNLSSPLESF